MTPQQKKMNSLHITSGKANNSFHLPLNYASPISLLLYSITSLSRLEYLIDQYIVASEAKGS
jgi:hypothetical protein